jgi:hypothetical protein
VLKLNCQQGGRVELHIQSHHWERRMPDWLAAAVAGLVGGALVIVLEFFWSTMVLNESPWRPTHKIAAMVMARVRSNRCRSSALASWRRRWY